MVDTKQCAVRGLVHPGAMCGKVLVGGGCGFTGDCEHQREGATAEATAATDLRRVFQIPKRSDDPIGYAKFWLGPSLWEVLIELAAVVRLGLHSGLVPGMQTRDALQYLRRLENRSVLRCTGRRENGHIIFGLCDEAVEDHLMQLGAQRAAAQEEPKQ